MLKHFARALAGLALLLGAAGLLAAPIITVYKDPGCGCCAEWVKHLEANGFKTKVHDTSDMTPIKRKLGVPEGLASCHTAVVDGYTLEGHVPAADVKRLLTERPRARGLAVPGMPNGSPGMETGKMDRYEVLLFQDKGKPAIYRSYGR